MCRSVGCVGVWCKRCLLGLSVGVCVNELECECVNVLKYDCECVGMWCVNKLL